MAVLDILQYPDPRLKQVSRPVTEFGESLHQLLKDLDDTMRAGPNSVGIAAPQVNRFLRVAIIDVSSKSAVTSHGCLRLVNPVLVHQEGEAKGREGCMSVPDFTGNVRRASIIGLRAQDANGSWREWECEGYEARAVQHELDHLDGLLFLDRIVSPRQDLFQRKVYR